MLEALYSVMIGLGLVADALIIPALWHAADRRTTGRLRATLLTLSGLILGAAGRLIGSYPVLTIGLGMINLGLCFYVLFLPDRGLLVLLDRRQQRKDEGRGQ